MLSFEDVISSSCRECVDSAYDFKSCEFVFIGCAGIRKGIENMITEVMIGMTPAM